MLHLYKISIVKYKDETKETNNTKIPKKKMSKGKIAAIVIVVITIIALLVFGGIQLYNNINQKEILTGRIQRYEQDLPKLKLAGDGKDIEQEIALFKELIEKNDLQNANISAQKIAKLMDELVTKNNTYVKEKFDEIEAIDQSFLTQEDTEQIKNKRSKTETSNKKPTNNPTETKKENNVKNSNLKYGTYKGEFDTSELYATIVINQDGTASYVGNVDQHGNNKKKINVTGTWKTRENVKS